MHESFRKLKRKGISKSIGHIFLSLHLRWVEVKHSLYPSFRRGSSGDARGTRLRLKHFVIKGNKIEY
jgi:hypothetical protein